LFFENFNSTGYDVGSVDDGFGHTSEFGRRRAQACMQNGPQRLKSNEEM